MSNVTPRFSVVIPLYNKEREIERTLHGVFSQELLPLEIIVVDDGSTDRGAEIAARISAANPIVKLVSQPNGGVSAARNRGIDEAKGDYICLLDADDVWDHGYLAEIDRLIGAYPGCGMYCAGFNVRRAEGVFPNETSQPEGVVENYFETAMKRGITHTSGVTVPREVFSAVGGFPIGMKMGEDLYMWARIASEYDVCYTPMKLYTFDITAQNRSASGFRMERTAFSFADLYREGRYWLNEYIAWAEIGRATVFTVNGYTREALAIERAYNYSREYRRGWLRLWVLNRLPISWRRGANDLYRKLAWAVAHRGRFD